MDHSCSDEEILDIVTTPLSLPNPKVIENLEALKTFHNGQLKTPKPKTTRRHKRGENVYVRADFNQPVKLSIGGERLTSQRYQQMAELTQVTGFVVNVHDSINFDIDFFLSAEQAAFYQNAITHQYTYCDLDKDFVANPNFAQLINLQQRVGTAHRCRLRGVGLNLNTQSEYLSKNNQTSLIIRHLIDRSDGWVICNLSDIDVYKRLLVDIFVPIRSRLINLRDFILNKAQREHCAVFYPYHNLKFN